MFIFKKFNWRVVYYCLVQWIPVNLITILQEKIISTCNLLSVIDKSNLSPSCEAAR